jgi:hypothetical protein
VCVCVCLCVCGVVGTFAPIYRVHVYVRLVRVPGQAMDLDGAADDGEGGGDGGRDDMSQAFEEGRLEF